MQRRGAIPCFLAGTVLLSAWLAAARADQHDPGLPALFEALRGAADADAAAPIEARIWAAWLHSDDQRVSALMERGTEAMNAGRFEEALDAFDAMVTAAPDFAEGWNKRATVYYLMGRTDDSVADIGRVLALEPRHFGALSGLGLCEARRHHDQAALDAFERALRVAPASPGVLLNIEALKQRLQRESI